MTQQESKKHGTLNFVVNFLLASRIKFNDEIDDERTTWNNK